MLVLCSRAAAMLFVMLTRLFCNQRVADFDPHVNGSNCYQDLSAVC